MGGVPSGLSSLLDVLGGFSGAGRAEATLPSTSTPWAILRLSSNRKAAVHVACLAPHTGPFLAGRGCPSWPSESHCKVLVFAPNPSAYSVHALLYSPLLLESRQRQRFPRSALF